MPEPISIIASAAFMIATNCVGLPRRLANTAASITWSACESSLTGSNSYLGSYEPIALLPTAFSKEMESSLSWISLAHTVLGGSRQMNELERKSLDEFTWAELEA